MAEGLGASIYQYDTVSWIGTEAAIAAGLDSSDPRARGWIVVKRPDRLLVRFVSELDGKFASTCDVSFLPQQPPLATMLETPAPLSGDDYAQYVALRRAITYARESDLKLCSGSINTVVVPASDPQGRRAWMVYLLSAVGSDDQILFGGHHRVTIGDDGTVIQSFSFLDNCLSATPASDGRVLVAHGSSPAPTEVHSFLSLRHEVPIYVTTDTGVWVADAGKLHLVQPNQ